MAAKIKIDNSHLSVGAGAINIADGPDFKPTPMFSYDDRSIEIRLTALERRIEWLEKPWWVRLSIWIKQWMRIKI